MYVNHCYKYITPNFIILEYLRNIFKNPYVSGEGTANHFNQKILIFFSFIYWPAFHVVPHQWCSLAASQNLYLGGTKTCFVSLMSHSGEQGQPIDWLISFPSSWHSLDFLQQRSDTPLRNQFGILTRLQRETSLKQHGLSSASYSLSISDNSKWRQHLKQRRMTSYLLTKNAIFMATSKAFYCNLKCPSVERFERRK